MLTELAAVAREVGFRILECREQGRTEGKWEGTQFKAAADLIADACMREGLQRIEDLPIVSEEDAPSQVEQRPGRYWLIDPIDGTASFAHGFAGFVCQAALIDNGRVLLAAVNAPALGRLYTARLGGGAAVNGEPIATRALRPEGVVLVDNYPEPRGVAARLVRDVPCARYVESGSIGLKICLVADGAADLFVKDVPLRDWDVAPPQLVLTEAGGVLRQYDGTPFEYTGPYEKLGLVAAASSELLKQITPIVSGYRQTS